MKRYLHFISLAAIFNLIGCATYRNDLSEVESAAFANNVTISKSSLRERNYTLISPISAEIKKLTAFHADPTEEMVDELLKKKAASLNADAVVNVIYGRGIGLMTWGYIEAHGDAVKFKK